MALTPIFLSRAALGVLVPPLIAFTVTRFSKHEIGGCKQAEITARGDKTALFALAEMTRCGVDIYNERGQKVWWGFLHDVQVDTDEERATLQCRGWWDTLAWRYYANDTGLLAYADSSGDRQNIGEGSGIVSGAQSFVATGNAWTASRIGIFIYKQGVPSDGVLVEIRNDSVGNPGGAVLSSALITSAEIVEGANYVEKSLSSAITVDATPKWIRISRTGAPDSGNYYQIGVNRAAGYAGGLFKHEQPAGTWITGANIGGQVEAADMNFRLIGTVETTQQIINAVGSVGEFITAVDIIDPSGVFTSSYRDGDATLQKVVENLLEIGTVSGQRLLCEVTRERRLRVYAASDSTTPHLLAGPVKYGISLDGWANNINVAYAATDEGASSSGKRADTGYLTDSDSVSEYGTRQLTITATNLDAQAAQRLRAKALATMKYPQVKVDFTGKPMQLYGPYNDPMQPDLCPVGVWAKLLDVGSAAPDSVRYRNASLVFISEASYDATRDAYIPTPRGSNNVFDVVKVTKG